MASTIDHETLLHFSGYPEGDELIPECEVVYEGNELNTKACYKECTKNPGHENFISVQDFGLRHLPEELRTERMKRLVDLKCDLTVRITVRYTSEHRPDTYSDSKKPYPYSDVKGSDRVKRYGTGFILMSTMVGPINERCPCPICFNSEASNSKWTFWRVVVETSTHVVYDETEARKSEFECFYDSEDRSSIETFHGDCIIANDISPDYNYKSDMCLVECVIHERLVDKLWTVTGRNFEFLFCRLSLPPEGVIVSHPHGGSKKISLGKTLCLTFPVEPSYKIGVPILLEDVVTCHLPSNGTASRDCDLAVGNEEDRQWHYLRNLFSVFFKSQQLFPEDFSQYRTWPVITSGEKDIAFRLLYSSVFYMIGSASHMLAAYASSCRKLYKGICFLISERLKTVHCSDTKHPELIDIGLLLWRYYLIILMEYFQNIQSIDHASDFYSPIVDALLTKMLYKIPHLKIVFDIHRYLIENSIDDILQSRKHSSLDDMKETMVRVLIGNDNAPLSKEIWDIVYDFVDKVHTKLKRWEKKNHYEMEKSVRMPLDEDYLQPGKISALPSKMTFTLPQKAKFAYKYYLHKNPYFIFPHGTKFDFLLEGILADNVPIPDGTEFRTYGRNPNIAYYVNYDTVTCPGSSGASVYLDLETLQTSPFHVHSCALKKNNRSGLTFTHGGFKGIQELRNIFCNVTRESSITEPGPLLRDSFMEQHGQTVETLFKKVMEDLRNPLKIFDYLQFSKD